MQSAFIYIFTHPLRIWNSAQSVSEALNFMHATSEWQSLRHRTQFQVFNFSPLFCCILCVCFYLNFKHFEGRSPICFVFFFFYISGILKTTLVVQKFSPLQKKKRCLWKLLQFLIYHFSDCLAYFIMVKRAINFLWVNFVNFVWRPWIE